LTVLGNPNPIDQYPVRNAYGASVGRVIGDGISLIHANQSYINWDQEIRAVGLMLYIDMEILSSSNIPSDYVFDFGVEVLSVNEKYYKNEIELRPLNAPQKSISLTVGELLQMNQNTTTLKVQFTAQWPRPFSFGNGARIYTVARMDSWENVPKGDVLTEGEQAMVGVFAGLYGISFFITLFLALSVLRFAPSLTNIILFFFILLTFLFRCIYLSIYASGGFRVEGSGSYVLVEPPSFFILSVASILIMSYGFCVYCLKKSVPQESAFTKFWTSWIFFTIFLYCVLAVVLALLSTLNASDTIVSDCYGRIVTTQSNFTVQAIRIAYHSFLLFLAIISAIVLFFLGRELKTTLKADSLSHLSIISGLSVLLTSILWVVYSALSGSSPYFVIPLWFCEAPPLLIVGFLVRPEKGDASSDSTYDRSRSWQSK